MESQIKFPPKKTSAKIALGAELGVSAFFKISTFILSSILVQFGHVSTVEFSDIEMMLTHILIYFTLKKPQYITPKCRQNSLLLDSIMYSGSPENKFSK